MPLCAGDKLGPYEILAHIGAGGMGEVYRALDPRLGRDVAVKVLTAEMAHDPDHLARFQREARCGRAESSAHRHHLFRGGARRRQLSHHGIG
jgi:eukaryotic-like serine/threonine-protein kinase